MDHVKDEITVRKLGFNEIGEVRLRDWKVVKIGDVCKVETGSTPSTKTNSFWENGTIKWITPTDLSKLNGKIVIRDTERKITEEGLKAASLTMMPKGSIIISSRAPIGYIAVLEDDMTFNQGCKGLIIKEQKQIDSTYLAYYLLTQVNKMQSLGTGSTFKEISKSQISNLQVLLPPLPEQQKIAEILSTVDTAIEKVDESIAKTERLKKGLMQTLLTKGVKYSGFKIQDDRYFKDTEIGRIPKEWEVVKLKNISLDLIGGGTPSTTNPDYWNGNIPWMTSAHINDREVTTGQRYITDKGLENSATNLVPKGNLLVATRVGIGKAAVNKIDIAISQDLTGIIIDKRRVIPDFLYWYVINNENRLKSMAQGSTIKGILREGLGNLKLPLPPLSEQKKIAEILSTVDKRLKLLRNKKERLERVKKGLMNDLLTGKKRVKI